MEMVGSEYFESKNKNLIQSSKIQIDFTNNRGCETYATWPSGGFSLTKNICKQFKAVFLSRVRADVSIHRYINKEYQLVDSDYFLFWLMVDSPSKINGFPRINRGLWYTLTATFSIKYKENGKYALMVDDEEGYKIAYRFVIRDNNIIEV